MRARAVVLITLLVITTTPMPAAAGGCRVPGSQAETNTINTAIVCFLPTTARVQVGDTVTWHGAQDGLDHNVTSFLGFGGVLPVGAWLTHRFDSAGTYPYACTLHPGMVGVVIVGDGGPTDTAFASTVSVPPSGTDPVLLWTLLSVLALIAFTGGSSLRHNKQRAEGTAPS